MNRPDLLAAFGLLLFGAAARGAAQAGPCGPGNARLFCIDQSLPEIVGGPEVDDRFGAAVAWGDFDGNGRLDLAVGVPGENDDAGLVQVVYSSGFAPSVADADGFFQSGPGETSEPGDEFGFALAAGDFDGDGFEDLAVGAPGEDLPERQGIDCDLGQCTNTGRVSVIPGSAGGLDFSSIRHVDYLVENADFGMSIVTPETARVGHSLAVADLDGDGLDDLVVGAPEFESCALNCTNQGSVLLFFGAPGGLGTGDPALDRFGAGSGPARSGSAVTTGRFSPDPLPRFAAGDPFSNEFANASGHVTIARQFPPVRSFLGLVQNDFGGAGSGTDDHFGAALAAGDFDADGFEDLAVGAPGKDIDGEAHAGRVYIAFGSVEGLNPDSGSFRFDFFDESEFSGNAPAANENFGAALAAGDADGDGQADLVIGAPLEGSSDAGFVFLAPGTASGPSPALGRALSQGQIGGASEAEDRFGSALALADLDGDGVSELTVGVPDEEVAGAPRSGLVYVTRALDRRLVFLDGFESEGTALWSATVAP